MKNLPKTAEELDKRFDEGEDLESLGFDFSKATRPNLEVQRVNVDFPKHFLLKLDREAVLRGVSRQALIKMWLYERLQFATAGVLTAGNVAGAGAVAGTSSYDQLTGAPTSGIYEAGTTKLLSGVKPRSK
jgi:hypothetical protein